MRILHIINSMEMGGGQSLLVELTPLQIKQGNQVTILQLRNAKDQTLINKVRNEGVDVLTLKNEKGIYNPINIFKIMPFFDKYDIVHTHLFPTQYWVALACLFNRHRNPIITTEHSTKNKRRGKWLFEITDKFIYRQYKVVVACSDKALESFSLYYPEIKAISIPNGVNIQKYHEAKPYTKKQLINQSEHVFIVTMVSRFIPSKRQDILVKAIAQLPEEFHVVLVGGHENEEGLLIIKKLAEDLGVTNRIHFLYTRGDVPQILKSSDVIVMSSEYEGLSLSSIEGMAVGKPFIASDVDGLREIVRGAGILVKCADVPELTNAISQLASNKTYYQEIASQCRNRSEQFDIHRTAEMYMSEYEKCIKYK